MTKTTNTTNRSNTESFPRIGEGSRGMDVTFYVIEQLRAVKGNQPKAQMIGETNETCVYKPTYAWVVKVIQILEVVYK